LPRALGYPGILSSALLVFAYVGRHVILDPKSPGPSRHPSSSGSS
jgi:hypothetical protein